ncbi:MAG: hypothetical protein ACOX52_24765 [Verrucomicrobiota bacterium]
MEPTHPDRLVENATAPSAGGSPDPDGEVRLRMRLPFRTGSRKGAVTPRRLRPGDGIGQAMAGAISVEGDRIGHYRFPILTDCVPTYCLWLWMGANGWIFCISLGWRSRWRWTLWRSQRRSECAYTR